MTIYQLEREELLSFNMTQAAKYYNVSPDVIGKRIRKEDTRKNKETIGSFI